MKDISWEMDEYFFFPNNLGSVAEVQSLKISPQWVPVELDNSMRLNGIYHFAVEVAFNDQSEATLQKGTYIEDLDFNNNVGYFEYALPFGIDLPDTAKHLDGVKVLVEGEQSAVFDGGCQVKWNVRCQYEDHVVEKNGDSEALVMKHEDNEFDLKINALSETFEASAIQEVDETFEASAIQEVDETFEANAIQEVDVKLEANATQEADETFEASTIQEVDETFEANAIQEVDEKLEANAIQEVDEKLEANAIQEVNVKLEANIIQETQQAIKTPEIAEVKETVVLNEVNEVAESPKQVEEQVMYTVPSDDFYQELSEAYKVHQIVIPKARDNHK